MITSFGTNETEKIWNGDRVKIYLKKYNKLEGEN